MNKTSDFNHNFSRLSRNIDATEEAMRRLGACARKAFVASAAAGALPLVRQAVRLSAEREEERVRERLARQVRTDAHFSDMVGLEISADEFLANLRERMGLGGPEVLLSPLQRSKLALIKETQNASK